MAKQKKIPERKCVVTNERKPKKDLIRVVRSKEGEVFIDPTGKKNGRGAYLSKDVNVVREAEKANILQRHLNTDVSPSIYDELKQFIMETSHE